MMRLRRRSSRRPNAASRRCAASVSMDKGFHSVDNQAGLARIVDVVVMPRKGRLSSLDRARQSDPEFIALAPSTQRRGVCHQRAGVPRPGSVPRPRDMGFKRYLVAIAVLARNIQRLGAIPCQQDSERIRGRVSHGADVGRARTRPRSSDGRCYRPSPRSPANPTNRWPREGRARWTRRRGAARRTPGDCQSL